MRPRNAARSPGLRHPFWRAANAERPLRLRHDLPRRTVSASGPVMWLTSASAGRHACVQGFALVSAGDMW